MSSSPFPAEYIHQVDGDTYDIDVGFVEGMRVGGRFFVSPHLAELLNSELDDARARGGASSSGGFIPAVQQIANVAQLPGIVGKSLAMPDVHSGYGFPIGGVAAFDMDDPDAVVSPGGVGFDINCGVRLIRTNLTEEDLRGVQEELAQALFDHIPVGVGSKGVVPMTLADLDEVLEMGLDWAVREGYAWPEDANHAEENGRMLGADPSKVSRRAKKRGVTSVCSAGGGNHYIEVGVIKEGDIFAQDGAEKMGLYEGQVVILIHSGSRGLGHQVATDALLAMDEAMAADGIEVNDKQLACARISSQAGQDYLAAMAAACNFAFVNRQLLTFLARQAFAKVFGRSPLDLDMHLVYDVSHNIAKIEEHLVDGVPKTLLVHRKGATRAFPPNHPQVPVDYAYIGQPIIIGGSMGTCSYVLLGTQGAMDQTYGSTCHGAGRRCSRAKARREVDYETVLEDLADKNISIRLASPKLIAEECAGSYKDVNHVIETCHRKNIGRKAVKITPVICIKG